MRISCSDLLVKQFGKDLQDMLRSEAFADIFPWFANDPFSKKNEDEFQFKDSRERNFLCITRDSRIVGFRTNIVIEDDLIGGIGEAFKEELHKQIINKHITDWTSRAKDENTQQILSIGTMYNPNDLLNWLKENAENRGKQIECRFKYTEVYQDTDGKLSVFITIPALDENDESTLPCEFSTSYFHKKREEFMQDQSGTGNYLWQCVFMQHPIAPTGLDFSYDNLQTYEVLPENMNKYNTASLDPQRKGKNFISMPIFNQIEDKFFLVGAFFQKKPMSDVYDDIVSNIMKYNVRKIWIETNTDTSLPQLIGDRLKRYGYECEIVPIYSTQNKETKLRDMQGYMKRNYVYPSRNLLKVGTDLRAFMEQFTSYSFDRPNAYDDAADSIAIHCIENIGTSAGGIAELEVIDRSIFNI